MSIRVLLSSKHKVVSEGIAAVLRTHPDIQVVGMAETDEKTQALCSEMAPHVVLIGMHTNNQQDLALMHALAAGRSSPHMVAFRVIQTAEPSSRSWTPGPKAMWRPPAASTN